MAGQSLSSNYELKLRDRLGVPSNTSSIESIDLRVAAYLARKGLFTESEEMISRVRERPSTRGSAEFLAYANYAEGIVRYFRDGPARALDKLNRAVALSTGIRNQSELPALPLAWLAACYRQQAKWNEMLDVARRAISSLTPDCLEASCRICIVLADALHEIREYKVSSKWYGLARSIATEIGDNTAVVAMLYNRAALRLFNTRIDHLLGCAVDVDGCALDIEAFSAQNYANFTREMSMPWVFDILRAQLLMLRSELAAAAVVLRDPSLDEQLRGWPGVAALRRADLALILSVLDANNQACDEQSISNLLNEDLQNLPIGDIALILDSCYQALLNLGSSMADSVRIRRDEFVAMYQADLTVERAVLENLKHWMSNLDLSTTPLSKISLLN